jgi:hypothetical protein
MLIRLTQKIANQLDSVDVTEYQVGDLIDLTERDAQVLIAEGWATRVFVERRAGQDRRKES